MSKHTPGPWEWDDTVWNYDQEQSAPWLVSTDHIILSGQIKCTSEANAKLIAAAPDLLELAQLVYNSFSGGLVMTFSDADVEAFGSAISKATGGKS